MYCLYLWEGRERCEMEGRREREGGREGGREGA
jgi:hypothetical protein